MKLSFPPCTSLHTAPFFRVMRFCKFCDNFQCFDGSFLVFLPFLSHRSWGSNANNCIIFKTWTETLVKGVQKVEWAFASTLLTNLSLFVIISGELKSVTSHKRGRSTLPIERWPSVKWRQGLEQQHRRVSLSLSFAIQAISR